MHPSIPAIPPPPGSEVPDDLPLGILEWDTGGRITRVNGELLKHLGWPPGEVIGQPFAKLWQGWPVGEGGLLLRAADGRAVRFSAVWQPLRDGLGRALGLRAFLSLAGGEEKDDLPDLLDRAGMGLAILDAEGRLQKFNETFSQTIGRSLPEEARGALGETGRWYAHRDGGGRRFELLALPRGGGGHFLLSRTPADPPAPPGEALAELAASAVHEIRNPLATVRGFLQLLNKDQPENNYLRVALGEIDRMNELLEDLLTLSRQTRDLPRETVSLPEVLREVAGLLEGSGLGAGRVRITGTDPLPAVSGHRNQLKQLFLNLAKNALEASADGEEILFRYGADPEGDVFVEVLDHGSGIRPEDSEKIFQPFFSTKERGTGLGLVVCREIVAAHDGRITFESEPGRGTTFRVSFPALAGERAASRSGLGEIPW